VTSRRKKRRGRIHIIIRHCGPHVNLISAKADK
jgi:hypothetical protein